MVELGRVDKITKVLFLSSHLEMCIEWHLETAEHIVACTGQKYSSKFSI